MSNASPYAVRSPREGDVPELGRLHVRVWREAYAGLMPQDFLDAMDVDKSISKWRRIVAGSVAAERATGAGPRPVTRVAEHLPSGALVGFATFGPARDDDAPTPLQLWVINVLAAHHGSGVADQLMAATIAEGPAYLWVVEGNARARAFYVRHGFAADGGTAVHEPTGAVEVRMVRPVGAPTR